MTAISISLQDYAEQKPGSDPSLTNVLDTCRPWKPAPKHDRHQKNIERGTVRLGFLAGNLPRLPGYLVRVGATPCRAGKQLS